MTAAVHPWWEWDGLLQTWRELDVPEGWRAEITGDGITMTPPPSAPHNRIAGSIDRALNRALPDDLGVYQTLGVAIPVVGRLYIPDICVVPVDALAKDTEVTGDQVLLAVEITSKRNARHDRKTKTWHYAHGPVPLHLLVDRYDEDGPAVTLYSQPQQGHYQHHTRIPFGESIDLPDPVSLTLDTTGFPLP
ncbi:MAG TPA: Uma2 family endonuclease [Micromonosporaceae bacterium]